MRDIVQNNLGICSCKSKKILFAIITLSIVLKHINKSTINTLNIYSQVYMCVADGVGSWRQYGVDPREYSHRFEEDCLFELLNVLLFDMFCEKM